MCFTCGIYGLERNCPLLGLYMGEFGIGGACFWYVAHLLHMDHAPVRSLLGDCAECMHLLWLNLSISFEFCFIIKFEQLD